MTEDVKILNRRLGEALGRPNGNDPRFAWQRATELFYFVRRDMLDGWHRMCWADRIGPVWVLCRWTPPETTIHGVTMELTREQWFQMFGGTRPYPAKGDYKPLCETALRRGLEPSAEATAFYIRTLREQIERGEQANKDNFAGRKDATTEQCEAEAQKEVDDAEERFMQQVADWQPASWRAGSPYNPGDRGGPVSFGGVEQPAAV